MSQTHDEKWLERERLQYTGKKTVSFANQKEKENNNNQRKLMGWMLRPTELKLRIFDNVYIPI